MLHGRYIFRCTAWLLIFLIISSIVPRFLDLGIGDLSLVPETGSASLDDDDYTSGDTSVNTDDAISEEDNVDEKDYDEDEEENLKKDYNDDKDNDYQVKAYDDEKEDYGDDREQTDNAHDKDVAYHKDDNMDYKEDGIKVNYDDADETNDAQKEAEQRLQAESNGCSIDVQLMNQVADLQKQRQRHLAEMCKNYTPRKDGLKRKHLDYLRVDDTNKVIYCYIPKVGCTNWLRMMIRLSGRYHGWAHKRIPVHHPRVLDSYGLRKLSSYTLENATTRLHTYRTFMFSRNPYERLLSAYKNKMLGNEWYFILTFGNKIKKMFRGSQQGGRVLFHEFLGWIVKLGEKGGYFDEHWRHYNQLCHPCEIRYDFIGKMETMAEDSEYIIRNLYGNSCPPKFPQKPGGHRTTDKVTSEYYANITQETIAGIYNTYRRDFDMFEYDKVPPRI